MNPTLRKIRLLMVSMGDLPHVEATRNSGLSNGDLLKRLKAIDPEERGEEGDPRGK